MLTVLGLAEPGRLLVERAVERIAEDRRGDAPACAPPASFSGGAETGHAQHRDVVVRVEADHLGGDGRGRRPRPGSLVSDSPATTWALVTTTPGAATQPLPSMPSPHAVPNTRTTLAPAPRTPRRRRGSRASAARHVGGRTAHGRQRVEARERVEDRPRGRQQLVELGQDRRALDVLAQRLRAGRTGARPRRRSTRRRARRRPSAPRRAARRSSAVPGAAAPTGPARRHPRSRSRARRRRAAPRAARAAARTASASRSLSTSGASRVPMNAPTSEADQRQRADDEPLHVAVDGEQGGERDDQPVDCRDPKMLVRAVLLAPRSSTFHRWGGQQRVVRGASGPRQSGARRGAGGCW